MRLSEFYQLFKRVELPLAYHHFEEGHSPQPPFLVYLVTESENHGADNWTYQKHLLVHVELYTRKKDLVIEHQLETLLDSSQIYFEKTELYLPTEKLYQETYTVTVEGDTE